jgi:predicted AlkP superfamily pyrophosphatase or phosphodiesterase
LSRKYAKKTTLVILIDAFSKTYFSKKYTPFLYDLSRNGLLTHIEPLFAFKGIETTIFTGAWPSVHNVWTEFCFADSQIGSKKDVLVREIIEAVDLLPNDEPKAKLRYAIEKYVFQKAHRTPSLMPAAAMAYFQPSQRKEITEPGAVGKIRTIFDVFRKKGIRFVFIEPWIWGDAGVLRRAKKLIKQEHNFNFWYLKFNHLDHLGHKIGPTPFAFKEQLKRIDRYVEEIVTLLHRKTPNLNVLVLADHGMSEVRKTVNILESLNQQKSEMYKEYIAFVDSTVIRFWFFTKKAKQEICEHLQQIKCGHILTDSEKKLLKIPLDTKYGEEIFAVDEGYVLHPCFFHSKSSVKGMHGYAYPKTPEALPIIILNGEIAKNFQISNHVTYTDIAPLILQSLLPDFSTSISAQQRDTKHLHPAQGSPNSSF